MATLHLPRQIEIGPGSILKIKDAIITCKITKPFIIMDEFLTLEPLQIHKKVEESLQELDIEFELFKKDSGEPTTNHVANALKILNRSKSDGVIAIGGGSAIDIAKSVALFAKSDHLQWDEVTEQSYLDKLPLIAIPTTAGTGSEATGIMVISDMDLGIKLNPGHPHLLPDVAILDPELTVSLPQHFTAFTGLDALTHAIEAYVSTKANNLTDSYALEAIRLISNSLHTAYESGNNIEARQNMLLASCYAGTAFFNASTNLAHAAGRALGTRFNVPHGLSVAVLLPFVMEYGMDSATERYRDIAVALGADSSKSNLELANESIEIIHEYNEKFSIMNALSKYIDDESKLKTAIPILIKDALSGNGVLTNRKVPMENDIEKIFLSVVSKLQELKTKL